MFFPGKETKEQKMERILLENYNRYYRLAYSYVNNDADAGDIVQNGAYKAIKNSASLKKEEYASTWLYRIMLNEIYRFLREKPMVSLEETEERGREDSYENIDLKRALDAMPQADRTVIVLKYFEELTLAQIAEVTDENINTIKSRLYRGLKKLRLELSDKWQWEEVPEKTIVV